MKQFKSTFAFRLLLVTALCLTTVTGLLALGKLEALSSASSGKQSKSGNAARSSAASANHFALPEGRAAKVDYRGDRDLVDALRSGEARARSLASADLDGDNAPDLIVGYEYRGVGIVTIQRGNRDAFAPADDAVFAKMQQGYAPESLMPTADAYLTAVPADFLAAGDFNRDGDKDIALAGRGRDLYLMASDAEGRMQAAELVALPGNVTALSSGEFRVFDGKADLAVGVNGPQGASLLIFDGPLEGISSASVNLPLQAAATAVEFGQMDDDPFMDVAVASGGTIDILHGWGLTHAVSLESRVERVSVPAGAQSLVLGNFVWDRESKTEVAALGADGSVYLIEQEGIDKRRFSEEENSQRSEYRRRPIDKQAASSDVESAPRWEAGRLRRGRWLCFLRAARRTT
jgi:hypothetical protein